MKRKLLALLLCGALLLTCSPAFAEGDGEPGGTDWAQTACTKTTGCTLDEGHDGECMVNNTDTTGTEGNGTGNTDPNTADPNIADPDGTDPDTADPDDTDPDTTDPDTTEPDGATPSEAVQALQAQIDALPDAAALESMTEEEQGAVFAELDALYIAIGALAPEEAAQLETARLDAAAEWFTSQIATYGEPVYVAQIGDTQYETLAKAIAAAGENGVGTEIELLESVHESITISANKSVTLNLGSYTLTNTEGKDTITVESGGTLTVTGSGTVDNVSHGKGALVNSGTAYLNGGTFTRSQEAGTFSPDSANSNSWYTVVNYGTMEVNGAAIKNIGGFSSTFRNGNGNDSTKATLTVKSGSITGGKNAIKNEPGATVNISGGTFSGSARYALMTYDVAKISGGEFSSSTGTAVCARIYESAVGKLEISDGTFSGTNAPAVLLESYTASSETNIITITGGTFTSTGDDVEAVGFSSAVGGGTYSTDQISISGGTYSSDVTEYLAADLDAQQDSAGNYIVGNIKTDSVAQVGDKKYFDLESALGEAATVGNMTVKLLKDVELTASVTISGQNVTLDLDGHTISGAINTRNTGLLRVKQGASLTIKDTNSKPGSIANTGTDYTIYQEKGSTLVLDGGITVKYEGSNNSNAAVYVQANSTTPPTLTVKDANLCVRKGYSIRLAGSLKSIVKIEGGTFMAGEGKSSTTSPINGIRTSTEMTISGGTFYNWSNSDNTKYLTEGCGFALNNGEEGFFLTVCSSAPGSYIASATGNGRTFYLTGGDLYTLLQYADLLDTNVEVTVTGEGVPVTFPANSGYGVKYEENIPTLTLTVEEGASLAGNIPLCVADVRTTGNVPTGLFKSADDATYAVTNLSASAWQGRLSESGTAIIVTHAKGTVNRYTSSDAIAAFNDARQSPGSTLKLLQDVSHSGSATLHGDMTLDLNGHTYTNTSGATTADVFTVPSGATLKIVDTSGNGGTLTTKYAKNALVTTDDGTSKASIYIGPGVTLSGGTVLLVGKNPTLNVYGTIDGGSSCAVQNNGATTTNSTINLYNGAVIKSTGHAVYHPGIGTLNVNRGAKVTGGNVGIEMRKGTLNVYEGATITGGSGAPSSTANPSGSTTSNAAIAVAQHGGSTDPVKVNVYGGEISGSAAVYESNPQGNNMASTSKITLNLTGGAYTGKVFSETQTGFITGGQFSTDVKEYIKHGYDQLVLAENARYQVGVYSDNSAANAMGTNVYKVTYTLDSRDVVDVYYAGLEQAQAAAEEFNKNQTSGANAVVTETPIRPTTSGGSGGTTVSRPVILSPTQPQTALTAENSMVTLRVQANGATGYQWYVNRGDGRGWVAIPGANGASLTIWPSLADNGNQYYCLASGGGGSTASPVFTLSVLSSMRPPKTGGAPGFLPLALLLLGAAGYVCSRRLCRR